MAAQPPQLWTLGQFQARSAVLSAVLPVATISARQTTDSALASRWPVAAPPPSVALAVRSAVPLERQSVLAWPRKNAASSAILLV